MVREENLKSDSRTERESCGVEEKRVISGEIQTVIRFSPPVFEVSSTLTQKPKNQSPEHVDVVAHGALSPLSAASGASHAEGMKSVRAGAHVSGQVSLNSPHQHPLYWLKPFCSHKLLVEIKFSSTGNAACKSL